MSADADVVEVWPVVTGGGDVWFNRRLGLEDLLEMFGRAARADSTQHHYGLDPWERHPQHVLGLDPELAEHLLDEVDRADAALEELAEPERLLEAG